MNETDAAQVLVGDPLEATFPRHYTAKEFMHDAGRLRDLARLQTRQPLNEAESAEVIELRRRITAGRCRRSDARRYRDPAARRPSILLSHPHGAAPDA